MAANHPRLPTLLIRRYLQSGIMEGGVEGVRKEGTPVGAPETALPDMEEMEEGLYPSPPSDIPRF